MAYPKKDARFECVRGCTHYTYRGNLRSLIAAAKRGMFGPSVRTAALTGERFILCPDVYVEKQS